MPHTEANRPVMANTGSAAPSEALAGSLRSPWQRCTCHARQIFLRFFPDARMENFLRGHVAAFSAWNGVPRVLLYDNLKSVVLERRGDAIRFHPTLLGFAGHDRYERRPVAIARVTEKAAWKGPYVTYVTRSSLPAASMILMTSMPWPR